MAQRVRKGGEENMYKNIKIKIKKKEKRIGEIMKKRKKIENQKMKKMNSR